MDPNESIDLSSFMSADQGADQSTQQGQAPENAAALGGSHDEGDGEEGQGDRGLGDDADDSDEWGETPAKDKDDEDDEEDDDKEDPADERESWRKGRLNKVKGQRDEARRRVAQIEADAAAARRDAAEAKERLDVYEAGGQPAQRQQQAPAGDGLPDMTAIQRYVAENDPTCIALAKQVEAIKAKADTFADAGSYLEALSEAQTEYKAELRDKSREVRTHLENQKRGASDNANAYTERLVKSYETAIEASTLPKIEVYAKRLVDNAASLHPTIREAVLTHEHQDIATAAITSNRAAFDWLVEATKEAGNGPLHPRAVAYVGELIAAYRANLSDAPASSNRRDDKPARGERAPQKGLPRQLRSRSTGASSSDDDGDPFQHARDVLEGRKKDPELRRSSY